MIGRKYLSMICSNLLEFVEVYMLNSNNKIEDFKKNKI